MKIDSGKIDSGRLAQVIAADRELTVALGRLSARIRIGPDGDAMQVTVQNGRVTAVAPAADTADLIISAPDSFWRDAMAPSPAYAVCSLTAGGAVFEGDFARIVAPHYGAWERLLVLMRQACGQSSPAPEPPDRRDTDDAIGRYAYVRNGDQEARIYYETAGQGSVPLLLHATAGADSRQWRHMLAYPELRRRFSMIAYDLPGHGKSLPPLGERWWEDVYQPSRETLMGWAVGLADTLALDQPVFLGCSVGGQLALDLAAYHADHFRAFVSLNGWASPSPGMQAFDNAPFRDPAIAHELAAARVYATTSPLAPEVSRHEASWIYRSNAPGIYAGDNAYFMTAHDLNTDGGRIDAKRTPLFVLAGEFDRSSISPEHGAPAIPALVPGAVYRMLPGLGHFAPSDDPEAFCAAIVPILDEVLAACPGKAP
jgi:pimeloyl-ACP methyl ester carboxylesterase